MRSRRKQVKELLAIPNVGKATVEDLHLLGLHSPDALIGQDPYRMHQRLEAITGKRHDPCVIDVFIAAVRYMEGHDAKSWWNYTAERKAYLSDKK